MVAIDLLWRTCGTTNPALGPDQKVARQSIAIAGRSHALVAGATDTDIRCASLSRT